MNRFIQTQPSAPISSKEKFRDTGEVETSKTLGAWQVLMSLPQNPVSAQVYMADQVHGGNIVSADELTRTRIKADGVWVEKLDTVIGVVTADCVPMVITSDKRALLLHVSRKSMVRGLLDNALSYLEPAEINHIYLGPHICEYHFDFDDEDVMLRRFRYRFPRAVHLHKGKIYLSMKKAIDYFIKEWQVHPGKVEVDGRCTFELPELPSYRRWLMEGGSGKMPVMETMVWRYGKSGS